MPNAGRVAYITAVLVFTGYIEAGPITVSTGTSSLPVQEGFNTFPSGAVSIFDGGNGVSAAERFVGQSVFDPGGAGFETFSGTPSGPLTLAVGAAETGVSGNLFGVNGLAGGTEGTDIGEGVLSVLFAQDQTEIGFDFGGATGGLTTIAFYANDGSLVDTVSFSAFTGDHTFTSDGPSFRGFSMSNVDAGGLRIDDLRFSTTAVPEPSSLMLLGMGGVALLALRKRQRSGT